MSDNMDMPDEFGAEEGGSIAPVTSSLINTNSARSMIFPGVSADVGLDGLFNTFRMGTRWANLKYGDPIILMIENPQGEANYVPLPRAANVLAVRTGTVYEMLQMHIGLNVAPLDGHDALHQRVMLKEILDKSYGEFFANDALCTVVYLIRDPE